MFGAAPSVADIEVSDDRRTFRRLVDIPNDGGVEDTIAFPATSARFFRVVFTDKPSAGLAEMKFDVENPLLQGRFQASTLRLVGAGADSAIDNLTIRSAVIVAATASHCAEHSVICA
jgi:hypothetical protein